MANSNIRESVKPAVAGHFNPNQHTLLSREIEKERRDADREYENEQARERDRKNRIHDEILEQEADERR